MWAWASRASSNVHARPVGTPARSITSLANVFEASRRAADRVGPNTGIPNDATASTTPAARGASGPTTTRSTAWIRASAATAPTSVGSSPSTIAPNSASPGLPGSDINSLTRSLWASFQPRACSRPPDPTSRTFIDGALRGRSRHFEHLGPFGPDRHPADRDASALLDELDVGPRLGRQFVEAAGAGYVGPPSRKILVDGLALVEDSLLAGELCERLALVAVGDGHPDRVERREDVELGQEKAGERVDPHRVPQCHQIEPAATPPPTRHCPVLATQLDHLVADFVVEFGRERTRPDPRDVRLRHPDDLVDCLGADTRSHERPSGGGVRRRHEGISAMVDVEQGALGALEQDLFSLA